MPHQTGRIVSSHGHRPPASTPEAATDNAEQSPLWETCASHDREVAQPSTGSGTREDEAAMQRTLGGRYIKKPLNACRIYRVRARGAIKQDAWQYQRRSANATTILGESMVARAIGGQRPSAVLRRKPECTRR
uniref:Uncharacterized protein n=1 Tax=Knipowitschia caucasica TaxID=637954 RepID=A0AAV2K2R7_KNICA